MDRVRKAFPVGGAPESLNLRLKNEGTFDTTVSREWLMQNGYVRTAAALGGIPTWSGEAVSIESALGHSVVWSCNRIISESTGYVPAILKQQKGTTTREATDHPMYSGMQEAPNEETTAQCFTELLTSHCVLGGDGFAKIVRRSGSGTALQLQQLLPGQVLTDREKQGEKRLVYVVKEPGVSDKTYVVQHGKPHDILHLRGLGWNGTRGFDVISFARNSIGSAIAQERNVANFWRNGGRNPYYLKKKVPFENDEDFGNFRSDWEKTYSQPWRAPILEGEDYEYHDIGQSQRDSQSNEHRLYSIPEICRWFRISPHLVGDLSRATFSNIEHLGLEFVKMTLSPWITRWEQEFWRCVLTPEEKAKGYFLRHNLRELLRGDFLTRMRGYASALQNGQMSIDEVRYDDDMDPLPNGAGSHYHIQTNMGTIGDDGEVIAPQGPQNSKLIRLA